MQRVVHIRILQIAVLLAAVAAPAQTVTNHAGGELFVDGLVAGSYTNTYAGDNVYQAITEVTNRRYSYLEHKWNFYLAGGTSVLFGVEAYRPSNSDGDDFVFSYSVDGATYVDMVTVAKSADDDADQTFALPDSIRGTVFIRVRDTNRKNNKKSLDTVFVDHLWIECDGEPATPIDNLLTNPGFEEGTAYWWSYWQDILTATTAEAHSGEWSCYVHDRTEYWQGPVHDLKNIMANGSCYTNSVWVKMGNVESSPVWMTIKMVANGEASYTNLATGTIAHSNQWTQLVGTYTLAYTGTLSELNFYVEGPVSGVTFYVDDACVVGGGSWREEADARIESVRKRDMRITLYDVFGCPLTNAPVEVRQIRHDFAFGSAMSAWVRYEPRYAAFFTNHFEWAVFENETKWTQNEPEQTNYYYEHSDAMRDFCVSNGIAMRGHCIFWEVQDFVQDWVKDYTNDAVQLRAAVSNRMNEIVTRYRDDFLHWDVNNEMLHGNFYSNSLGNEVRTWMFQRAKELDPDATLFVNDYGVVSYSDTERYLDQIRGLLSNGAPVEAIGAQCHMWELSPYLVLARLTELSQLGLPIWCTEFDVAHPDEFERARLLETFYRTAFSHPGVDGILMWGFWASNHWRGADAALVNGDWTTNAAGRKYEELMREWTTVTNLVTDAAGQIAFRGFHGTYDFTVSAPAFTQTIEQVGLHAGDGARELVGIIAGPDSDGDGMPDAWETANGLSNGVNDVAADADGDGMANGDEYVAFTAADSALSWPEVRLLATPDAGILSFDSALHRRYRLEFRTNLFAGGWIPVVTNRPGVGGLLSVTNPCGECRGYYRLGVSVP